VGGWRLVFVVATGCAFRHGAADQPEARDAARDAVEDAVLDADAALDAGACSGSTVWLADFSTDPTLSGNFAMRDGGALGGTLSGGIWSEPGTSGRPLDTQPKQNFLTRTLVHVRMRGTSVPTGTYGAVFWINVGYNGTSFSPLFIDSQLVGNTQTATLYGKTDNATTTVLAQVTGLDAGMHDFFLDITPATHMVVYQLDTLPPVARTFPYFALNGNDDRWATVTTWSGANSDFDLLRVEVCP
jgi:hypothetical protein